MERYRSLPAFPRWIAMIFTALGLAVAIVHLFNVDFNGWVMPENAFPVAMLGLFLPLVFLFFPATAKSPTDKVPWYDLVAAGLCVVGPAYILANVTAIYAQGWSVVPPQNAVVIGAITWLLLLEASRRTTGYVLTVCVLIFSVYPLVANLMPGFLESKPFSFTKLVGFHFLGTNSILSLQSTFGRLILSFLVFAAVLQVTKVDRFFMNLALSLLGRFRGGPAKVCIASSALFGTMSGSVLSNIMTVGSLTIPTMKKTGISAEYAAAIESVASTGGVLMPPVMGITAFVIADFLRIPYGAVALAAAIPALLYYVSVYVQVDFYSARKGLRGIPKEERPSLWATLKEGWSHLFCIFLLAYFIFYGGSEAKAPIYASLFLIAIVMVRKKTRLNGASVSEFLVGLAKVSCELVAILAGVGMISGALTITGAAQGFSSELSQLAGNNLLLIAVVGALASFILGLPLTMLATYIFLAIFIAPALINQGVYPLAAHMFLFYWGMISGLTPPVALAAQTAAALAGADGLKTANISMRLSVVAYIVPFFFLYNPALLAHGTLPDIAEAVVTAVVGTILLSGCMEGFMYKLGAVGWVPRALFGLAGLILIWPNFEADIIGASLAAAVWLAVLYRKSKLARSAARLAS